MSLQTEIDALTAKVKQKTERKIQLCRIIDDTEAEVNEITSELRDLKHQLWSAQKFLQEQSQ